MKRIFKRYMYHFILAGIIIVCLITGFSFGVLTNKAASKEDNQPYVSVDYLPSEHSENRTSLGEFKLTAYCTCSECCGAYSDGFTATMTKATPGRTIAVDPNVIPYGSIVEINGEQYISEDCGGAIKGNHIDVLCASHELAENFGVQYAEVYIVTE